jgi:hypothetical protein
MASGCSMVLNCWNSYYRRKIRCEKLPRAFRSECSKELDQKTLFSKLALDVINLRQNPWLTIWLVAHQDEDLCTCLSYW